jgi:PhnB protein
MQVQPYLFFDGRCEEAINFYRKAIGAEVTMMMRYKESPEPPETSKAKPEMAEKIMHASLRVGDSTVLASDGFCQGKPSFQGFSLTLIANDEPDAERLFRALGQGGKVNMPLTKTFYVAP